MEIEYQAEFANSPHFDTICDNWTLFWIHIKKCKYCKERFEDIIVHSQREKKLDTV